MYIKYNLKHLYEDRYAITWEQPMGDGTIKTQMSSFRCKEFSLEKFLQNAQQRISAQAAQLRMRFPNMPRSTGHRLYEWDRDASALPEMYQRQLAKQAEVLRMVDLDKTPAKPKEPELFEVVKRNNVWTLVKHETELLTWEEACAELAKRIA